MIQTDAAINPGNSGGALIDVAGKLIGINSTIVSESGGSEGISFSIPADKAIDLLDRYLASGPSGYLGVAADYLTLMEGRTLFRRDMQGYIVLDVKANGPAEKAGIEVNDIIVGVNGNRIVISDANDEETLAFQTVFDAISSLPPGELVRIEVFRAGTFLQLEATLGIGEPQIYRVAEEVRPRIPGSTLPLRPAN
jgi:serine protease DegS